jgi:hypothetical protein
MILPETNLPRSVAGAKTQDLGDRRRGLQIRAGRIPTPPIRRRGTYSEEHGHVGLTVEPAWIYTSQCGSDPRHVHLFL